MKHFNSETYDSTIQTLLAIKRDIANSNHDRMSVDSDSDFEPSSEELDDWLNRMNLPIPSDFEYSIAYELPPKYWTNIFGSSLSQEEELEVRDSKPYLELFKLYSSVFEDLYEAAKEESAYYENEFLQEQNYENSMRFRSL
jgi:hypothetical protein